VLAHKLFWAFFKTLPPRMSMLRRFARAMGCDIKELLSNESRPRVVGCRVDQRWSAKFPHSSWWGMRGYFVFLRDGLGEWMVVLWCKECGALQGLRQPMNDWSTDKDGICPACLKKHVKPADLDVVKVEKVEPAKADPAADASD
jgi:hypothetical protein